MWHLKACRVVLLRHNSLNLLKLRYNILPRVEPHSFSAPEHIGTEHVVAHEEGVILVLVCLVVALRFAAYLVVVH